MPTKKATASKKAAPKLDEDEQARADQEAHYKEQSEKDDPAYEGDTENKAPYAENYE